MPEVSRFYGITIVLYSREHPPAHFHARYNDDVAQIEIETLEVIQGYLPARELRLVRAWGELHRGELKANWELLRRGENAVKIAPLD